MDEDNIKKDSFLVKNNRSSSVSSINLKLFKGEIREYARNTNVFGDYIKGYCLILSDSDEFNDSVLICPLYKKENINKLNTHLIKLNNNILIDNKEVLASLKEIRFVSKRRFIDYKIKVDYLFKIDKSITNIILDEFKIMIDEFTKTNRFTICNRIVC